MRPRVKVLFVCFANSIRSQMAEAMAKAYGKDVMDAMSAGLMPIATISPVARQVMRERNLSLDDHFPKGLNELDVNGFDLIINISGLEMPKGITAPVRDWEVRDPVGHKDKAYYKTADDIERLVMALVIELRGKVA